MLDGVEHELRSVRPGNHGSVPRFHLLGIIRDAGKDEATQECRDQAGLREEQAHGDGHKPIQPGGLHRPDRASRTVAQNCDLCARSSAQS
ncbi:MAG: hypothetical protein ACHQ50_17465 [Fimbriimonadales bacterium]